MSTILKVTLLSQQSSPLVYVWFNTLSTSHTLYIILLYYKESMSVPFEHEQAAVSTQGHNLLHLHSLQQDLLPCTR